MDPNAKVRLSAAPANLSLPLPGANLSANTDRAPAAMAMCPICKPSQATSSAPSQSAGGTWVRVKHKAPTLLTTAEKMSAQQNHFIFLHLNLSSLSDWQRRREGKSLILDLV